MRRQRGRVGLMAAALVGFVATSAAADVTTERSASILVFPKVIADGTRDTIIQITNTSNSMVYAHCFYVNAAPDFFGNPRWVEIDFDIFLTKQQPTHWVVSTGRRTNLPPEQTIPCSNALNNFDCNDAGFAPGLVPPVADDFTGELKCIEVDPSGAPLSGNHLKGEATIFTLDICLQPEGVCAVTGGECLDNADCTVEDEEGVYDAAKYNAIGVLGNENNDGDHILCLGGEPTEECPRGAEYNACPEIWILNHFGQFFENPVIGEGSEISTSITIVPCTQDFENQAPEPIVIQFVVWNEFEQPISASVEVECWADLALEDINPTAFQAPSATLYNHTTLRSVGGFGKGIMVVGTETHTAPEGFSNSASFNLHMRGERAASDVITIPPDQIVFGPFPQQ